MKVNKLMESTRNQSINNFSKSGGVEKKTLDVFVCADC